MEAIFKNLLDERINCYGVDTLHDEEILTILTGAKIAVTKQLLEEHSLPELIKLIDTIGLTKAQKKKLSLLYEFTRRVSVASYGDKPILTSTALAGEFFLNDLRFYTNEVFKVALLDAQNRLIALETIAKGVVNECPVYTRTVVKSALDYNAVSVILAHLHPGGSLSFSSSDISTTKNVKDALNCVGIKVIDHIVVARGSYASMAEKGII